MEFFVLAMVLYPQGLKKAQAEVDAIIGHARMPTFEDQQSLPYIGAIVKEVLRWRASVPLGVFSSCRQFQNMNDAIFPGLLRRCMQVSVLRPVFCGSWCVGRGLLGRMGWVCCGWLAGLGGWCAPRRRALCGCCAWWTAAINVG